MSRDICPCYAGTEDGESLYILIQESRSCACMQWSSCCCALEHIVIIVVIDHDGGDAMHACIGTCLEAEAYFVLLGSSTAVVRPCSSPTSPSTLAWGKRSRD